MYKETCSFTQAHTQAFPLQDMESSGWDPEVFSRLRANERKKNQNEYISKHWISLNLWRYDAFYI